MITKTVIKDFVSKRCPYLVSMELEDKSLVQLLEKSVEIREKYREFAMEEQEFSDSQEPEEGFDLVETLCIHMLVVVFLPLTLIGIPI